MKQTPTQFINSQYLWIGFKEKVLPFLTDTKYNGRVHTFVLPRIMSNSELQKETNSIPIPVKYFASAISNFLKTADKSKWYIGHINTGSQVVAFNVDWRDEEWNFRAYDFDDGDDWHGGRLFLSFATADSETLSLDTSDSLTLPNDLIINGITYVKK